MIDEPVRTAIAQRLGTRLTRLGLAREDLVDEFDLVRSGVLDSLAFVDLIAGLESDTGRQVDLERALDRKGSTTVRGIVRMFSSP